MKQERLELIISEMFPKLIQGTDWSIVEGELVWNNGEINKPLQEDIDGYNAYLESLNLCKISEIEKSITTRRLVEAILGIDRGWLKETNARIGEIRGML